MASTHIKANYCIINIIIGGQDIFKTPIGWKGIENIFIWGGIFAKKD